MSTWAEINHDVATMSRTHAGARLVVVLGGVVFVAALQAGAAAVAASGGSTPGLGWAAGVAMVGLSVLSAWHPHTVLPFLAMGFLIVNWVALMPGVWSPWLLPAALALLVMHTSVAVCATVPAQAPLPREIWALNGARVAGVGAVTALVWLIAAVLGLDPSSNGLAPVFVGFTVLLALLGWHYRAYVLPQVSN